MSKEKQPKESSSLFKQMSELTSGLSKKAIKAVDGRIGGLPIRMGATLMLNNAQLLLLSKDQRAWMERAGEAIKDARETAGFTVEDMADALNMNDKSVLEAVESGSATLSFDMIIRLTSLLSRNDPIPFFISLVRGFNPRLWALFEDWGFGHIPTMIERDRLWMNIYRGNLEARKLGTDEFDRVLMFCRGALESAMAFKAQEQELAGDSKTRKAKKTK